MTATLDLSPGSIEWTRRVSPSKAAAILGLSPWESPRSLWHKMRGDLPAEEQTAPQERGELLEGAVLTWWRRHHPNHTTWREQPSFTISDWCVATPDAITALDGAEVLVEAKTAGDMDDWGDPGTDEIPAYYLVQVFLSAHVANINGHNVRQVHVPVLGPRLEFSNYVVDYEETVAAALLERLREFHASLQLDVPPPLDDTVATYDAVRRVHPDIEAKAEVELTEAEALALVEHAAAKAREEAAERLARSTVLDRMGRAQYATCNGVRIARRQPHGDDIRFVRIAKTTDFVTTGSPA